MTGRHLGDVKLEAFVTCFGRGRRSLRWGKEKALKAQGLYSGGYALKNPEGASVNGRYEVNYLVVYSVV